GDGGLWPPSTARRIRTCSSRALVEIVDAPDAALALQLDLVPARNGHERAVARDLNGQRLGLVQAVDEGAHVVLDRRAGRRRQHPHQPRVAASSEDTA